MSGVQRFADTAKDNVMRLAPEGDWVSYTDFARVSAELAAAREEAATWKARESFAVSDLQRELRERDATIRGLRDELAALQESRE